MNDKDPDQTAPQSKEQSEHGLCCLVLTFFFKVKSVMFEISVHCTYQGVKGKV